MARSFNGTSDHVVLLPAPLTEDVLATVPFSVAVRFKDGRSSSSSTVGTLFSVSSSSDLFAGYAVQTQQGTGKRVCAIRQNPTGGGSSDVKTVGVDVASGTGWHSAVGVFAANNDRRLYVDGTQGLTTVNVAAPTVSRNTVGAQRSFVELNHHDGVICDAAVWGRALSKAEADAYYNGVSPLRIGLDALVMFRPMFGHTEQAQDMAGKTVATVSGTTRVDHYPNAEVYVIPAASGASSVDYGWWYRDVIGRRKRAG